MSEPTYLKRGDAPTTRGPANPYTPIVPQRLDNEAMEVTFGRDVAIVRLLGEQATFEVPWQPNAGVYSGQFGERWITIKPAFLVHDSEDGASPIRRTVVTCND